MSCPIHLPDPFQRQFTRIRHVRTATDTSPSRRGEVPGPRDIATCLCNCLHSFPRPARTPLGFRSRCQNHRRPEGLWRATSLHFSVGPVPHIRREHTADLGVVQIANPMPDFIVGRPSTSLGIQRYEPFAVRANCVCGRYRVVGVRSDRLAPRVFGFLSVNEIRNCHRNCAQDISAPRRSIGCFVIIGNVLKCTEKTGVQRVPNSPNNILLPARFFLWILTFYGTNSTEM